ncbi:helix-turn-helix of DDE superfamily endonuclease domain-containing protein [Ditylenchus destructor]|nr:helix-turn-helix of DDE superfamily endonuclease domain-containing protein [Ditylenchus destructor]
MAEFMDLQRSRRVYRSVSNPLDELTDIEFHKRYRMEKDTVRFISDTIRPDIEFTAERGRKTPAEVQVLCTLDYMRSPGFQNLIASDFGISQPTVSKHVERVTKALAKKSAGIYPISHESRGCESQCTILSRTKWFSVSFTPSMFR